MLCDLIVRSAQFEVAVVATRELLFHNEIFQPGQQFTLLEQANFVLLDCEVHSYKEATEWVAMSTVRLQAEVAKTMRPTLNDMGWEIAWANARSEAEWGISLEPADGDGRKDTGLLPIPSA